MFYLTTPNFTDRIAHTTAFVTPVVEHWLEREIAQWVHPMKDRSDDPSHHERKLLPQSYISLPMSCRGAAGLYFIPPNTTMNIPKSVELLEQKLTLHVLIHGCSNFMPDDTPCHRSNIATNCLKKQQDISTGMAREQPISQSSRENLWTIVKDNVAYTQPSSAENLRQAIKEV